MTSNHDKRDPDKVNPMLEALRSAKKNREARAKELQAHLEKAFQKKVDKYIAAVLELPSKITEAVNQGKTSLDVDIRNATTSFASNLTRKNDTFCYVQDKELSLKFSKSWTDFFKQLLSTVAVEEFENSQLTRTRMEKIDGKWKRYGHEKWDRPVDEYTTSRSGTRIGPHKYYRGCCGFKEDSVVHSEAYKYPDILCLRW